MLDALNWMTSTIFGTASILDSRSLQAAGKPLDVVSLS